MKVEGADCGEIPYKVVGAVPTAHGRDGPGRLMVGVGNVFAGRGRAAEEVLDGVEHVEWSDRLLEVINAADLAGKRLEVLPRARGEGDDGHIAVGLADPLTDFYAGHVGQQDIQDDEVGLVLAGEGDGGFAVVCLHNVEAVAPQHGAVEVQVVDVVLDQENQLSLSGAWWLDGRGGKHPITTCMSAGVRAGLCHCSTSICVCVMLLKGRTSRAGQMAPARAGRE